MSQSANLWAVKAMLWQALPGGIDCGPSEAIIDSMPVPICHFVRAHRCRRLRHWKPVFAQRLGQQGLALLASYKSVRREKVPWLSQLKHRRYHIETVLNQFVSRLKANRGWARDTWHLCSR